MWVHMSALFRQYAIVAFFCSQKPLVAVDLHRICSMFLWFSQSDTSTRGFAWLTQPLKSALQKIKLHNYVAIPVRYIGTCLHRHLIGPGWSYGLRGKSLECQVYAYLTALEDLEVEVAPLEVGIDVVQSQLSNAQFSDSAAEGENDKPWTSMDIEAQKCKHLEGQLREIWSSISNHSSPTFSNNNLLRFNSQDGFGSLLQTAIDALLHCMRFSFDWAPFIRPRGLVWHKVKVLPPLSLTLNMFYFLLAL